MYTSDEKDKAEKRKMRSVIMIAAGVLLLVVGVLLIVLAPTLSDLNNMMPNVIGIDRDKAKAMLEKHGLEVIEIEVESDEYEPGVVIEQSIAPGKEIEQGMTVELTINVAKGGTSNMFGSAPPMESIDPDDADADSLERNNGGGYSGGNNGTGGNNPTKPGNDKDKEEDTETPTKPGSDKDKDKEEVKPDGTGTGTGTDSGSGEGNGSDSGGSDSNGGSDSGDNSGGGDGIGGKEVIRGDDAVIVEETNP